MFKYFPKQLPTLETERLIIREITDDDIQHIIPIIRVEGLTATNLEEAKVLMDKINAKYKAQNLLNWGMVFKETNEMVGSCGYYRGFENNIGEIGYIIMPQFRRMGFAVEASQALIDYGFKTLKLSNISAYTTDDNEGSIAVLKKLGLTQVDSEKPDLIKYLLHV